MDSSVMSFSSKPSLFSRYWGGGPLSGSLRCCQKWLLGWGTTFRELKVLSKISNGTFRPGTARFELARFDLTWQGTLSFGVILVPGWLLDGNPGVEM